ncbi:MAG: ATP-binding protein [Clostridiales bacterium]|nr:ATP-binding protein [Clostridiales bacterium]
MGAYLNSGNEGFRTIRNSTYVDKTGLIAYINRTVNTPFRMTCFSRPRRFGKSFAAKMLCAYYDKSCDSEDLFKDLRIAGLDTFKRYLNQFDVIYLDITWFLSRTRRKGGNVVQDIQRAVIEELRETFSDCIRDNEISLPDALLRVSGKTGDKFIIIIDEWDAIFREEKNNDTLQKEYIQFLRALFKGGQTTDRTIAAAYMTGILPIKKYGTQSALTDFREFTMVEPLGLSEYVGFTEKEVQDLCKESGLDFYEMKQWYDGYTLSDVGSVYSPNSVMSAVMFRKFKNYWKSSETYEDLKGYIGQNFDGLKDAIVEMLGGGQVRVNVSRFQNDMTSFRTRDDILTLLIHLGYLAYDETSKKVGIPNREISEVFQDAVEGDGWEKVEKALSESEELLAATIRGDCVAVENALEDIHESNFSILKYNDENSLSCAIVLAYYTARNDYEMIRELPAGKGFADIAFIPHRNSGKPAMIIELKYDKDADTAIRQIKDNRYSGRLKDYAGRVLLVGINYDKDAKGKRAKKHTCMIEEV